jgi:hypothetical protein
MGMVDYFVIAIAFYTGLLPFITIEWDGFLAPYMTRDYKRMKNE